MEMGEARGVRGRRLSQKGRRRSPVPARARPQKRRPRNRFWETRYIKGLFRRERKPADRTAASRARAKRRGMARARKGHASERPERSQRKPESVEVTTPRLYVGNLSFEATESDLFELFNGVGQVQNAEVVTYKHNQRSKGFAFVQMQTVEEAQRAVTELHDKDFLGRKLVVSGAKSTEHARTAKSKLLLRNGRRGGECCRSPVSLFRGTRKTRAPARNRAGF